MHGRRTYRYDTSKPIFLELTAELPPVLIVDLLIDPYVLQALSVDVRRVEEHPVYQSKPPWIARVKWLSYALIHFELCAALPVIPDDSLSDWSKP